MARCDMCGKDDLLFRAVVEGSEMKVCRQCSSFGKVLSRIVPVAKEKKRKEAVKTEEAEPEIVQIIVENYAQKVKDARESLNLKQDELAMKISEKVSIIHKIETGHYEPNLLLAKKLEKFLKINLVEERQIDKAEGGKKASASEGFTIGDMLKIKK